MRICWFVRLAVNFCGTERAKKLTGKEPIPFFDILRKI